MRHILITQTLADGAGVFKKIEFMVSWNVFEKSFNF